MKGRSSLMKDDVKGLRIPKKNEKEDRQCFNRRKLKRCGEITVVREGNKEKS